MVPAACFSFHIHTDSIILTRVWVTWVWQIRQMVLDRLHVLGCSLLPFKNEAFREGRLHRSNRNFSVIEVNYIFKKRRKTSESVSDAMCNVPHTRGSQIALWTRGCSLSIFPLQSSCCTTTSSVYLKNKIENNTEIIETS